MLSSIRSLFCRLAHRQHQNVFASRFFSSATAQERQTETVSSFVAIRLSSTRRLLRISGVDAFIYLQSLLTNDLRQLLPLDRLKKEWSSSNHSMSQIASIDQPVIYSYLLSSVGRVLADLYVYRGRYRSEDGEYIVDIDAKLATALKRLLLGYNLSRNVKVELANDLDLWTVIPMMAFTSKLSEYALLEEIDSDDIKLVADPRLGTEYLGYRFLTRLGGKQIEDIGKYIKLSREDGRGSRRKIRLYEGTVVDYTKLRYQLGIAEGADEILQGFYYPFELNGDLMNAVSLNKGLYTSEEKVIKVYSRDIIKRRIVPIKFLSHLGHHQPPPRTIISAEPRGPRQFGELRGRIGRHGIASLWVPFANNKLIRRTGLSGSAYPILTHVDTGLKMRATIPDWWPKQFDQTNLAIPDYPRCLFDLSEEKKPETPMFYGIPEDRFTTSLQVIQDA